MSDFDKVFDDIHGSALAEIISSNPMINNLRDSKIVLVTELDEPPLSTGEYYYDEEENTLYVGCNIQDKPIMLNNFLSHSTSLLYKPLARVNVGGYNIYVPTLEHDTKLKFTGVIRYSFGHEFYVPTLTHSSASKLNGVVRLSIEEYEFQPIILEHESEVIKNG